MFVGLYRSLDKLEGDGKQTDYNVTAKTRGILNHFLNPRQLLWKITKMQY